MSNIFQPLDEFISKLSISSNLTDVVKSLNPDISQEDINLITDLFNMMPESVREDCFRIYTLQAYLLAYTRRVTESLLRDNKADNAMYLLLYIVEGSLHLSRIFLLQLARLAALFMSDLHTTDLVLTFCSYVKYVSDILLEAARSFETIRRQMSEMREERGNTTHHV